MAKLIFRHPDAPAKKNASRKLERKKKLIKALLIFETIVILIGTLAIINRF